MKSVCAILFAVLCFSTNTFASRFDNEIITTLNETLEYNPDVDLDILQLVRRHGYQAQSHLVVTEDGYILTLHRIPGDKTGRTIGKPVFVQHGLFSSSADFLDGGEKSLGFMLADQGLDVWLGNARGNKYSTAHVSLSIHSNQFWNFSFHEMGVYDLPAVLTYVANVTNKPGEIYYIGHSMGTTMFFVFSSMKPKEAEIVKSMIALAPAAYMTHMASPIRYLAPFSNNLEWISKYIGIKQFLPNSKLFKFLSYDCRLLGLGEKICDNMLFYMLDFNKKEFNITNLPVILNHSPAGTSAKNIIHYAQEVEDNGNFEQFNYGEKGNMIQYGQPTPPKYKVENIQVPMFIIYAEHDKVTSYIDVEIFASRIGKLEGKIKISQNMFNHIDFLFGVDAPDFVYKPTIKFIMQ